VAEDVTERRVLQRDEKDRLIEEVRYYGDDSGERIEYVYDDKDRMTSVVRYDEDGGFDFREEYAYDESGSLQKRQKFDSTGKLIDATTISRNGDDCLEEKETDGSGQIISITTLRFSDKGQELSSEHKKPDGSLMAAIYSVYDEKGRLVEKRHKDFYSKILRYVYDEDDRMLTQELYDGSGLLLRKNVYEYDESGRLLNEQVFEIDASRGGRDKHFGNRYEYELFD
jgi:YD repeat-containing protein